MIVVDASVVIDLILGSGSEAGDTLSAHFGRGHLACAPHLLDAEVGQGLRRFALRGDLAETEATTMVADLADLPVRRYPHRRLVARAFELRSNVTVYDGLYLALAEALSSRLLTGDVALRGVPGVTASVDVVMTSA